MDNSVFLISMNPKIMFLGRNSLIKLKIILKSKARIIIHTIKWVLGDDFLKKNQVFKVKLGATSMLISVLLDLGEENETIRVMIAYKIKKQL